MRNSILVLGGGGFIGRHLCERFAADGHDVVAATRRPTTFQHPGIRNAAAPYDDASQFQDLVSRCDAVVHAASASTPGSSAAQPQLDGNLRTTLALIEALQDHPAHRLLYPSSGGTLYGDRRKPAHEDDPLRPRSYHGAGKAAAEHFIHAWATQYAGSAVLLRPSNVYGPGQPPGRGFGIIPTAFDCTLRGVPLTVWRDGTTLRDYLYIDDFVALCSAVTEAAPQPGSQVFNAASGHAIPLTALLDRIDAVTGIPVQRVHAVARPVDVRSIAIDNTAARQAFGWHPATTLEQGLQRTWQWFSTRQ